VWEDILHGFVFSADPANQSRAPLHFNAGGFCNEEKERCSPLQGRERLKKREGRHDPHPGTAFTRDVGSQSQESGTTHAPMPRARAPGRIPHRAAHVTSGTAGAGHVGRREDLPCGRVLAVIRDARGGQP